MAPSRELPAPGLLGSLWRFRRSSAAIALGLALLSGLAGFLLAAPPSATAMVALKNPGSDNLLAQGVVGDAALTRYTTQRADFISSDAVLDVVAQALPAYSVTELRKHIVVVTSAGSNQLTITASAGSPSDAVQLVNNVVDSYRRVTAQQVRDLTTAALRAIEDSRAHLVADGKSSSPSVATSLAELNQRASNLQTDSAVFNDGIDFVQLASLEDATGRAIPVRYVAAGLLLGLVLAALLAWLRADHDRRVEGEDVPESMLDAPLLGSVVIGRRHQGATPTSGTRQFRMIGASLTQDEHAVLAVVEAGEGLERPEVTAGLALALASEGARVLVVDADPEARLTGRLRKGIPGWLRSTSRGDAEVEAAAGVVPRQATVRGVAPGRAPAAALLDVPDPDTWAVRGLSGAGQPERGNGHAPDAQDVAGEHDIPVAVEHVPVPGTKGLHLLPVGASKARYSAAARRRFVDDLVRSAGGYDLVLLDLPFPEASPLVPALLRASTELLAVVPHGVEERALDRVRRTASIFAVPMKGYVFTRLGT